MKDHVTLPGYFAAEDCDLAAFAALCEQVTTPSQVPFAADIQKNIPLYDAGDMAGVLDDRPRRAALMAEWARVVQSGPGVFVIRAAYADTAVIDAATSLYTAMIAAEKAARSGGGDHFAPPGSNDRVWNALQKLCEADPAIFARYFGNRWIATAAEAWLGPNYQMTAQVNLVHPGGVAQQPHRDYHLGFYGPEVCATYPAHIHDLSAALTLQGGIAHCDMGIEAGPTKLLPWSQTYRPGYLAAGLPAFRAYFEDHFVQLPLSKGDAIFFNPALFHAGGNNRTSDQERFVNLLQVGSAFGRSIETVDRRKMCALLYPVLQTGVPGMTGAETAAAIAACAEGYSFPTNLDRDPPIGGLAPETQAALMHRALASGMPLADFRSALDAMAQRQLA